MKAKKIASGVTPKYWVVRFGLANVLIFWAFLLPSLLGCGRDESMKKEAISMAIPQDSTVEQILLPTRPTVSFVQPVEKKREASRKAPQKKTSKERESVLGISKDDDEVKYDLSSEIIETLDLNQPVEATIVDPDKVYETSDLHKLPSFPGGDAELQKYLAHNLKYPAVARENGLLPGKLVLQFYIEKDGNISNIQVIRGFENEAWSKEAQRVIEAMPKWSPGEINENAVRIKFTLPIIIRLE